MGKLILKKGGVETQYINGVDFTTITPQNGVYSVGVDLVTGYFEKLNPDGTIINFDQDITGSTNTYGVTYSGLVNHITGGTLDSGSFYLITDFKTCYDQPDFDYNGSPITTGNYKQGPVEPILVLATSANTISEIAYQPAYPKDRILYDWTWNTTEVTSGVAFGRITERIDEFNNRTDYDHRNILFKRYKLFTYRQDQPLNGTIAIDNTNLNNVTGTTTQFTNLSVGDVIYVPNINPSYFEVIDIVSDTIMSITGDTLSSFGSGFVFYKTIEETNDTNRYFSYKRTNVKTYDFVEYATFSDAISESYAKNNYVGNCANNYQDVGYGAFILANNVFLEGRYESNKFGDYCYNNTFGTDNQNNVWGDWCYENVSTNDIDNNIIGHNFNNNLINANLVDNRIGNDFENNRLLGENSNNDDFQDNIIGNGFNNNLIYSEFYKNEILDNFNDNVIGDFGNLDNFGFYRNYIRNNFNENTIRRDFQNNQIGTNFQNNEINGESQGNTILNGFVGNVIGSYFSVNNIGNAFNNNNISDSFYQNTTDYYFNSNVISNDFNNNNIGTYFVGNEPTNLNLFGWNNLSTVSTRTYSTFNNSLDGNFGKILGKEFVMEVTSTSQYFKIKFTQWSTNDNGFQYTREEIDSSGNSLGPVITFTLANGGTDVDYIVPGVVEITRSGNSPIYNSFAEPGWDSSVSPSGTSWNSIYTQSNNGERFTYNEIGNNFSNNTIGSYFGYDNDDDETEKGNKIGNNFRYNNIVSTMYSNVIGNDFNNNTIYSAFYKNEILVDFNSNTIGDSGSLSYIVFYRNYIRNNFNNNIIIRDFDNNQIGTNFRDNNLNGVFQGNTILNGFNNNTVGSYFALNNIGNAFNDNFINDNFYGNTTSYGFENNYVSNNFYNNTIGANFENNTIPNLDLFGWGDLSTVSTRTYDTFNNSLGGGQLGNRVLNREFIMRITSTSQYFKIKFTQWTAGGSGGGFQYTREEIDSAGNSLGPVITFIKTDNGSEIDVIVPGVVEITRSNNNGIYNVVSEANWNSSVSPSGTTWNSIYTEPNNGQNFAYNKIGNNFNNNTIDNDFGFGGNVDQGNIINDVFENNTIGQFMYSNVIGNYFTNNTVGDNFENNTIKNYFIGNTILDGFESNEIGDYFGNNGTGPTVQNTIFSNFKYNKIGNFFGNDTNFPTVGGGIGNDGGNIVNTGCQFNVIGDNVIFNALNLNFTNNKIGNDFWFNVFGQNTSDNTIGNLFVSNSGIGGFPTEIGGGFISNNLGNYSAFNEIDTNFQYNKIGDFFGNAGVGTQNIISNGFANNNIGNHFGDNGFSSSGGNNIGFGFEYNQIGSYFYSNQIDQEFYLNQVGSYFFNNTLGKEFYSNQIGGWFQNNQIDNRFYLNVVGFYFINNTLGNQFISNHIGDNFTNNNLNNQFQSNHVGNNFQSNQTGNRFRYNQISHQFSSNQIVNLFEYNVIGYNFSSNILGNQINSNKFGNNCQNNNVGNQFDQNIIGDDFDGNTIGSFFNNNDISTSFQTNTVVDYFRQNTIKNTINTVDFSVSTHVYGDYNCIIQKNSAGTNFLSYYDASNVLTIPTNIND